MPVPYDFTELEHRWQARWDADRLYEVDLEAADPDAFFYNLCEFPYPSAEGLHVGHVFKYGGVDVLGRYQRMRGRTVFQPMGFDSFGINAENYALKIGQHPTEVLARNIPRFRRQLSSIGMAWDWSRVIDTSRPEYYRWTQWIFTRLLRAGLAYRAEAPVTWCPSCATVLANELVEDGRCERCATVVEERVLRQWFLRTTAYAERLVDGLDALDWPMSAKRKQRNWVYEPDGSMRLHDWLVSRQRYWGTPIPVIHCDACGLVPVPDEDLPLRLPDGVDGRPTGDDRSPLAHAPDEWLHPRCPTCGARATRDTDVLDNFVESSWYFLRYPSTEFDDRPWDPERTARTMPVDFYAGGPEHVTRHHLFARFLTMALHDLGLVGFDEPFPYIRYGGIIHHADGARMSKSRGNVVEPDSYVAEYGGDVFRLHLLFTGPWGAGGSFSIDGVVGVERFVGRVWRLVVDGAVPRGESTESRAAIDRATVRVTAAVEKLSFNVGIAALMECLNVFYKHTVTTEDMQTFVLLLAPFAPYVAEELWSRLGGEYSVHTQPWPADAPKLPERRGVPPREL